MINIVETDLIWNGNLEPLNKGSIDSIALHHMAHPTWDFLDVHRAHQNQGWAGIGYNWWVAYDGTIYKGRGFNKGAGVGGHNSHIISIGFQGDYHNYKKEMPKEQYEAGVKLIRWLKPQLPNLKRIDGHKYWNATACPGQYFPLTRMIEDGWKNDVEEEDVMINELIEKYGEENVKMAISRLIETFMDDGLPSGWAVEEVEKAKEMGITDGSNPEMWATRQEVMMMVYRGVNMAKNEK